MLKCWDEQPLKRPTFTEIRSKFELMLLADERNEYIDLRIDHNKLYYQQVFPVENRESRSGESGTSWNTDNPGARTMKSPSGLDVAPSHKLLSANNMDDNNCSKQSLNSESAHAGGQSEGRDRTYENAGRPVSMYLSSDRKERENDYVDEPWPSSAAQSTFLTPNAGALWSNEGGIEMDRFEHAERSPSGEQNCPVEIQISLSED